MNTLTPVELRLSYSAIADEVCALSALHGFLATTDTYMSAVLNREHDSALLTVIRQAIIYVSSEIMESVASIATPDISDDTVAVEVYLRRSLPDGSANAVRRLLEGAVTGYTLHLCYLGIDKATSQFYADECNERISRLRQMTSRPQPKLRPAHVY